MQRGNRSGRKEDLTIKTDNSDNLTLETLAEKIEKSNKKITELIKKVNKETRTVIDAENKNKRLLIKRLTNRFQDMHAQDNRKDQKQNKKIANNIDQIKKGNSILVKKNILKLEKEQEKVKIKQWKCKL